MPIEGEKVNDAMTTNTVVRAALENPDPNFCRICGDHTEDHKGGTGACEIGDCRCRSFVPER